MSEAWHPQLGGDTDDALLDLLSAVVARNVTSVLAPRQFLPAVTLDVPTLMAAVVVFTFLVQFFFTVVSINLAVASSSSSSTLTTTTTTTTTTTPATTTQADAAMMWLRTQTVTPAPAPSWRFFPRGSSGLQRLWRRSPDSTSFPAWHRAVSHPLPPQPWDTPPYFGMARGSFERPWVAPRGTLPPEDRVAARGGRKGPRRMSLLYEVEDAGLGGEALDMMDPLTLSSHRVSLVPEGAEAGEAEAAGLVSNVLYGAERWGNRLQEWNILSSDGAQALTQTLLMVRCAFISPDFCAKLDHHFRRQHDLNLVAAMMNHNDYEDLAGVEGPGTPGPEKENTTGAGAPRPEREKTTGPDASRADKEKTTGPGAPHPEREKAPGRQAVTGADREVMHRNRFGTLARRDKEGVRTGRPGELEVQGKIGAVGLVDQRSPPRKSGSFPGGVGHMHKVKFQSSTRHKGNPALRQDKRRVAGPVGSGAAVVSEKTWGVYVVVTLAAVVLVVMEAAHRILQFVTNPGRSLHHPHLDPLATLYDALHRWHHLDDS